MRILYIIPALEQGGAETHLINLANEISKLGHDVTIASTGGSLEKNLSPEIKLIHAQVERKNLFTGIYAAIKLSRYEFDIIHAHSRVPAWISWIISGIRRRRVKWLMTAHAMYSLNFGIEPFKHADGVICVSEAVKSHLKNYLPDNVIVIPNGIKISGVKNSPSNENKFLFVGRLTRLKKVDVILNALSGLKNFDWSLNIIGDGAQRNELENLSRELEINDRVKFLGGMQKSDVENYMSNSDCLLFPSSSEGMGLAVLEAVSMKLPVIASDIEALREISSKELSSGLIEAGNVEKWREAIKNFILEKKSSEFNPDCIISISEMAARTEDFYKKLISYKKI